MKIKSILAIVSNYKKKKILVLEDFYSLISPFSDHTAFLMYSEVTSLISIRLDVNHDPNPPRQPIRNPDKMDKVIGLAFDHASKKIYFSDILQGNIQSVNFDGTDFRMVVAGMF